MLGTFFISTQALAGEAESQCGGGATSLLSYKGSDIYICHGPYEKINITELDKWQTCIDGMFYLRTKVNGIIHETLLNECVPTIRMEYRINNDNFEIKHYFSEFPGFTEKERIIESYNIKNGKNSYTVIGEVVKLTQQDIDNEANKITEEISKPFNGNTYFTIVYTAFHKIRDYAFIDPAYSLSILKEYQSKQLFDGEVAEVLSNIIEEAELISKAVRSKNANNSLQPTSALTRRLG